MTHQEWEKHFYEELTNEERKAIFAELKAKRGKTSCYSDDTGALIQKDGVTYIF